MSHVNVSVRSSSCRKKSEPKPLSGRALEAILTNVVANIMGRPSDLLSHMKGLPRNEEFSEKWHHPPRDTKGDEESR